MTWLRRHFGTFLLVVLVAGCVVLGTLLVLRVLNGLQGPVVSEPASGFSVALRSADLALDLLSDKPADKPLQERIIQTLDDALDIVVSVEAELSVLKRRRRLALMDASYGVPFAQAAVEASGRFPRSETLAAVAGEALLAYPLKPGDGQDPVGRLIAERIVATNPAKVPEYAVVAAALVFSDPALQTIKTASGVPWASSLMEAASEAYLLRGLGDAGPAIVNASLLRVLSDDALGARKLMGERIKVIQVPSDSTIRFMAELEYDFGDKHTAAAFFTRLEGQLWLARAADAFWLAGDSENAREAWKQLAGTQDLAMRTSVAAALFNLARSSPNPEEAHSWAARLYAFNPAHAPGRILYARLKASSGSVQELSSSGRTSDDALMDLERLKLLAVTDDVQKIMAQSWLLMNKWPDEPRIAEWVAWFFTVHVIRTEAAILAGRYGSLEPVPSWLHNLKGFVAAASGHLDEAEAFYEEAASTGGDWRIATNLALISEKKRQSGRALELYGIASSLKPPNGDAARIQLRIARSLVSLGRQDEAVKALEYGLYLDPLNGDLRYELKKARLP